MTLQVGILATNSYIDISRMTPVDIEINEIKRLDVLRENRSKL